MFSALSRCWKEKSQSYEVEYIDLTNLPEWFVKISPNAEVPILITDDEVVLFESMAICEYLEEVYPPSLHPSDPAKKAQHRAWAKQASSQYLLQCSTQRSATKEILEKKTAAFARLFEKVEKVLDVGIYFAGDSLSMVDMAWIPLLHRAAVIKKYTGFDFLDGFPKVTKWQEALLQTRELQNSVPEAFEQYFIEFYLNEERYLGRLMRQMDG